MRQSIDEKIQIDEQAIADFCRRWKIAELSLFGSVLRDDFSPESDVDVLVEFYPGQEPGLFRLARMELDFAQFVDGRKVDMRTAEDLSRYFRDEVVSTAELQYAA
jgi:uncharacterized protein